MSLGRETIFSIWPSGHDAQVGHAGRIGGEQDKEIAGAGELVRHFIDAGAHAVEAVIPELIEEFGFLLALAVEREARRRQYIGW